MSVVAKKLSALIENAGFSYEFLNIASTSDPLVQEVTLDLDEVSLGVLFIARKLWYVDTHQQIDEAIQKGAVAVLVSDSSQVSEKTLHNTQVPIVLLEHEDPSLGLICARFYEHPCAQLKVYGVTGTNGKTSAVTYLADLLTALGERVAVIGTVEYRFEHRRLAAANTTPDALVIQRFARQALDLGATALTLEVSSHALSLDRVAGVYFDAVGFTSFGRDHLDFHGSLEDYRNAKGRLFDDYLMNSLQHGKTPIAVAHDDVEGQAMLGRTPGGVERVYCHVQTKSAEANVTSETKSLSLVSDHSHSLKLNIQDEVSLAGITLEGTYATQQDNTELPAIKVGLIGDYHPANAAIALGMLLKTHQERFLDAWFSLQKTRGVPGRMERVILPDALSYETRVALVDYAHTPDAITRAIQAIKAVHQGALSVIIGCGGDRDRGKRPQMLKAALQEADQVWLTSDNPRNESPQQIIDDALSLAELEPALYAEFKAKLVGKIVDRRECIAQAWQGLTKEGALLITGKGHESYQEVQGRRYRLQDHEALRAGAWAEHKQLDLQHVPYLQSCLFNDTTLDENNHLARLLLLLREACFRPNGLVLRCLKQTDGEEPSLSTDHFIIHCHKAESSTFESYTNFSDFLWTQLAGFSPQHKEIHVLVSRFVGFGQVSGFIDEILGMANEFAYPHAELTIKTDLSDCKPTGGWSKQSTGPKIPSLV